MLNEVKNLGKKALKFLFLLIVAGYVVFPVDILPEAVLGPVGYIEDFGLVLIAIFLMTSDMDLGLEDILSMKQG